MRVLVTGADGQLGYDVVKRLDENSIECLGTSINELDITDEAQTNKVITKYNPDVVVHCAAYTAVDKAEDERELCYNINVLGTKYVAAACKEIDAKMVYISTDYVFDGKGNQPFEVTDQPNPINYYGKTKYKGELEVQKLLNKYFIIRISWVFGKNGNNFVKTMLKLMTERQQVSVVADQFGSPTWAKDLAELIMVTLKKWIPGIYHYSNQGRASWYEFALAIRDLSELNCEVIPVTSAEFPTAAQRPTYSLLDKTKVSQTFGIEISPWKDSLSRMIQEVHVS